MRAKTISIILLMLFVIGTLSCSQQKTDSKGKVECELFDDVQWKEDY